MRHTKEVQALIEEAKSIAAATGGRTIDYVLKDRNLNIKAQVGGHIFERNCVVNSAQNYTGSTSVDTVVTPISRKRELAVKINELLTTEEDIKSPPLKIINNGVSRWIVGGADSGCVVY